MGRGGSRSKSDEAKFISETDIVDVQRIPREKNFDDEISYMFLAGKGDKKPASKGAVIRIYDHYFRFKKTSIFDSKLRRSNFSFKEVKRIVVYSDYPKTLIIFFEDENTSMKWYWFLRFRNLEACNRCSHLMSSYISTLVSTKKSMLSSERKASYEAKSEFHGNETASEIEQRMNALGGGGSGNYGNGNTSPYDLQNADNLEMGQLATYKSMEGLNTLGIPNGNGSMRGNGSGTISQSGYANGPGMSMIPNYAPLYVEEFDSNGLKRVIHYSDGYKSETKKAPEVHYERRSTPPPEIRYVQPPKTVQYIQRDVSPQKEKIYIMKQPTRKVYVEPNSSERYQTMRYIEPKRSVYKTSRVMEEPIEEPHEYIHNRVITIRPRSSAGYRAADTSKSHDVNYDDYYTTRTRTTTVDYGNSSSRVSNQMQRIRESDHRAKANTITISRSTNPYLV